MCNGSRMLALHFQRFALYHNISSCVNTAGDCPCFERHTLVQGKAIQSPCVLALTQKVPERQRVQYKSTFRIFASTFVFLHYGKPILQDTVDNLLIYIDKMPKFSGLTVLQTGKCV